MKYKSILWALSSMLFCGCAVEEVTPNSTDDNEKSIMQTITVQSASFDAPATRVSAKEKTDGGYTFPWQGGDKIAVNAQASYATGWGFFSLVADDEGSTSGKFEGLFKLLPEVNYYSFYPAKNFDTDTDAKVIPIDYTGQMQTKDADLSHLTNYIYMAAKGDENFNFTSKHVGSLIKIQLKDPFYYKANKIILSIKDEDFVLKGTVDLTQTTVDAAPDITATEKSSTFRIGYSVGRVAVTDNTITVYAMIAPTDLTGKKLWAIVKHGNNGDDAIYSLEANPVNPFVKGKAYALTGTIDEDYKPEHEAVDLGLSVKWATCNVGADTPGEFGGYYAWGETKTKYEYTWDNCFDCVRSTDLYKDDSDNCWAVYKKGGKTKIEPDSGHDTARERWGDPWRMPTAEEFEELVNQCTWKWTTMDGNDGYEITGPNGNSIFLPSAGVRYDTSENGAGSWYWSSTLGSEYSSDAVDLYFNSSSHKTADGGRRYGQSIRPVRDKD